MLGVLLLAAMTHPVVQAGSDVLPVRRSTHRFVEATANECERARTARTGRDTAAVVPRSSLGVIGMIGSRAPARTKVGQRAQSKSQLRINSRNTRNARSGSSRCTPWPQFFEALEAGQLRRQA